VKVKYATLIPAVYNMPVLPDVHTVNIKIFNAQYLWFWEIWCKNRQCL